MRARVSIILLVDSPMENVPHRFGDWLVLQLNERLAELKFASQPLQFHIDDLRVDDA